MNLENLKNYCLSKKGVEETYPFGEENVVMKVMNKIFLITHSVDQPESMNVKCDPEQAIELRASYPSITPGYHMNKKLWNTIFFDGSLDDDFLKQQIDHSYEQVVAGLKKKEREALAAL